LPGGAQSPRPATLADPAVHFSRFRFSLSGLDSSFDARSTGWFGIRRVFFLVGNGENFPDRNNDLHFSLSLPFGGQFHLGDLLLLFYS
jgi:hypothetical protein